MVQTVLFFLVMKEDICSFKFCIKTRIFDFRTAIFLGCSFSMSVFTGHKMECHIYEMRKHCLTTYLVITKTNIPGILLLRQLLVYPNPKTSYIVYSTLLRLRFLLIVYSRFGVPTCR